MLCGYIMHLWLCDVRRWAWLPKKDITVEVLHAFFCTCVLRHSQLRRLLSERAMIKPVYWPGFTIGIAWRVPGHQAAAPVYGHFGKSQNLQLIKKLQEPGPFPGSVSLALCVGTFFILYRFFWWKIIKDRYSRPLCKVIKPPVNRKAPGTRSFPTFCRFSDVAKWPTCPTINPALFHTILFRGLSYLST